MELSELSVALDRREFDHHTIYSDGDVVTVTFTVSEHARSLAALLLKAAVPRRYLNNVVDARVKFSRSYLSQVMEVLG